MTQDPSDHQLQVGLVIGLAVAYMVALGFFAVMWLSFGHTDLRDIVIGGFGFLSSAMAAVVGHYIGSQNTARNLRAGAAIGREQTVLAEYRPAMRPVPPPPPAASELVTASA